MAYRLVRRLVWPASSNAAQAAEWPKLARAQGSLEHDLALEEASGRAGMLAEV